MKVKKILAGILSMSLVFSSAVISVNAESQPGDINADGNIDLTDLSELSLAVIGDKVFTEEQIKAADINLNGKADLSDLARLRQYLSKNINYEQLCSQLDEQPDEKTEFKEITDYRVNKAGLTYLNEPMVVNSLDEFKENLENLKYYPTTYEEWLQYNKLDVDFEKEILLIFNDNNSCNGERQTVKNIKVDKDGKIVVAVDDLVPMIQTSLASNICIFISVPKEELPEGKNITAVCEKNVFADIQDITAECTSYDLVSSFYDEEIYFNQPVNNVIDSVEKFNELNRVVSEDGESVLRIYDNISEKISITDEFFSDNILLVSTLIEGAGAVNQSSVVCVDYRGNIKKAIKRGFPSENKSKSDDITAWNLVTVVPRSAIKKKEDLFGREIDKSKFTGKIISMSTKDESLLLSMYY